MTQSKKASKIYNMQLGQWIDLEHGRGAALGRHLGITRAAVWHWTRHGVPREHMLAVRDFTGGAVTLEDMAAPVEPMRPAPVDAALPDPVA